MDYTEQEIEMLARFIHDSAPPTTLTFEQLVGGKMDSMRRVVSDVLADGSADSLAPATRATLRLMREAREEGAAEMRERAIAALRALPDGTWGDDRGEMSPWPDAIAAVKALKVPQ